MKTTFNSLTQGIYFLMLLFIIKGSMEHLFSTSYSITGLVCIFGILISSTIVPISQKLVSNANKEGIMAFDGFFLALCYFIVSMYLGEFEMNRFFEFTLNDHILIFCCGFFSLLGSLGNSNILLLFVHRNFYRAGKMNPTPKFLIVSQ